MLAGPRLTSTVLLSLAVSASAGVITRTTSPVTLALTKQFNLMGTSKILQIDQARAKVLMARAKGPAKAHAEPFNVPAINQAVYYSTTVGIGNPPKNFTLLIDTGSSNTWVGAQPNNAFVPSPSKSTGNVVEVVYGSGAFTGAEYMDTVHLGDVSIANQGFGGAVASQGFDSDIDGILGIGPVDLTCGTLFPDTSACIPTVTDNAFTEGLIGAHQVGISFAPSSSLNATNGQITFGGIDYSRTNGPFTFVPITSTSPAKQFVGINQTISYGDADVLVLPNTAGITDTGTTLLLLATDAFKVYQNLTGAVMDKDTGLLRVTPQQFGNLRTLLFNIGGSPFELIPNAQAFPRALNGALGGSSDYVYLIVGDLGTNSGGGLDFINGMTFLERFYQVYDIANNRVGFATTQNTYALTN